MFSRDDGRLRGLSWTTTISSSFRNVRFIVLRFPACRPGPAEEETGHPCVRQLAGLDRSASAVMAPMRLVAHDGEILATAQDRRRLPCAVRSGADAQRGRACRRRFFTLI